MACPKSISCSLLMDKIGVFLSTPIYFSSDLLLWVLADRACVSLFFYVILKQYRLSRVSWPAVGSRDVDLFDLFEAGRFLEETFRIEL
ncbi:hypothetical protein SDJN03_18337, partial [Cucurbita argyrosperma subsp. sororia]